MSTYDASKGLYWTSAGFGPFPVLTVKWTDRVQHLAVPAFFVVGERRAVCDQQIELEWAVAFRPDGPLPICESCVELVEGVNA